jgi:hypothetical protein
MELVCRDEPWNDLEHIGSDLVAELGGGKPASTSPPAKKGGGEVWSSWWIVPTHHFADPLAQSIEEHAPKFAAAAQSIAAAVGLAKPPTHDVNFKVPSSCVYHRVCVCLPHHHHLLQGPRLLLPLL